MNVTRVGFRTLRGADVVRSGIWAPVIVDLALDNQARFDGTVRVSQIDGDGDEAYDVVDVHLSAETGGIQRVFLYALPNPFHNQGRFAVELRNADGEAIEIVSQGELSFRAQPARQPTVVSDDDLLLLSVSSGTVGRLADLDDPELDRLYARRLRVAHSSPDDLPEHWIGLEAVDCIRWENANPSDMTERQLKALVEWVRQGGRLVIMAAPADGSFSLNKTIDAIMPVDIEGVQGVTELAALGRTYLSDPDGDSSHRGFASALPAARCKLRSGSTLLVREDAFDSDFVSVRYEGRGQVYFVGMPEQHLFSGGGSAVTFYEKLFRLGRVENEEQLGAEPVSLFPTLAGAVSFATSGGLYLAMAAALSIGYALAATMGSWWFLGLRGWRQHSWTAFAIVAGGASLLSVVAVNSVRGLGERLHQVSIVDMEAGRAVGYATTFFGLKVGVDKRFDAWLPDDPGNAREPTSSNCFLRPVSVGIDPALAPMSFADPGSYRLMAGSAMIKDVRVRATLKQLEGRWQGRIGGVVTGEITVRGSWRITDESFIVNKLGVDLRGCYLFLSRADITAPFGRSPASATVYNRGKQIYAFPLGDLPADGGKVMLAPICFAPLPGQDEFAPAHDRSLADAQAEWEAPLRSIFGRLDSGVAGGSALSLGNEEKALLLLTTIGEYDPMARSTTAAQWMGVRTWSRDRLRQLDLREQLQRDRALLVGFADDPGPVRLFLRQGDRPFLAMEPEPEKSWTMYRVLFPVKLIAGPTDEEDEPDIS